MERTGLTLQASQLLRADNPQIAETFCRAPLGNERGFALGCLGPLDAQDLLIERAMGW